MKARLSLFPRTCCKLLIFLGHGGVVIQFCGTFISEIKRFFEHLKSDNFLLLDFIQAYFFANSSDVKFVTSHNMNLLFTRGEWGGGGEWERVNKRRNGGVLFVVWHTDPGSSPTPETNKDVEKTLNIIKIFRFVSICTSRLFFYSKYVFPRLRISQPTSLSAALFFVLRLPLVNIFVQFS